MSSKKLSFMTSSLLGLLALFVSTDVFASAAQKQNPWAGPFLGVYAGEAWGDSQVTTDAGSLTGTSYFASVANIDSVNTNGSALLHPDAVNGGVFLGANLQHKYLVYGLVADFGSLVSKKSKSVNNVLYPTSAPTFYNLSTSVKTKWLFTARASVGLTPASSSTLVYVTGGLALTTLEISNSFLDNAQSLGRGGTVSQSTQTGWTVGAGLKFRLSNHLSLGGEYLYVDFDETTASGEVRGNGLFSTRASPFDTSADLKINIARVLLTYTFC